MQIRNPNLEPKETPPPLANLQGMPEPREEPPPLPKVSFFGKIERFFKRIGQLYRRIKAPFVWFRALPTWFHNVTVTIGLFIAIFWAATKVFKPNPNSGYHTQSSRMSEAEKAEFRAMAEEMQQEGYQKYGLLDVPNGIKLDTRSVSLFKQSVVAIRRTLSPEAERDFVTSVSNQINYNVNNPRWELNVSPLSAIRGEFHNHDARRVILELKQKTDFRARDGGSDYYDAWFAPHKPLWPELAL